MKKGCVFAIIVALISVGAQVATADAYVFKSVAVNTGYDWDEPTNWEGGEVPPAGADVIISNDVSNTSAGNNICVTVLVSRAVSVNSIKFHEMPGASSRYGHGARVIGTTAAAKLTIGAGGLELIPYPGGEVTEFGSTSLGGAPILDIPIELAASQTWHIPHNSNSKATSHNTVHLNLCKPLTAAADIAWKVQGIGGILFREGVTSGFLGAATFACDMSVTGDSRFGGEGSTVTLVNAIDAFGDNAAGSASPLIGYSGLDGLSVNQDVAFGTGGSTSYFVTRLQDDYMKGDTEMAVSGTWTGDMRLTSDPAIYFVSTYGTWSGGRNSTDYRTTAMRKDAFKTVMRTDMSAIPTSGTPGASKRYPHIQIENMTVVDGDNVLGAGNALRVTMHGRPSQGTVCGLLARDGRTVASYIYLTYRSIAGRTTEGIHYFGIDGPGECTFSGTICPAYTFATGSRYCLTASSNGVFQFTGTLTSTCGAPYHPPFRHEIAGLGTVRLSGTFDLAPISSGLARNDRSLLVRGGTLVLGNADAGGPHPQDLGANVPKVVHVRACIDTDTFSTVSGYSSGAYTFSNTTRPRATIDGVKLEDGDRVLVLSSVGNQLRNGIYKVDAANKKWIRAEDLDEVSEFLPDLRVVVDEGERLAGQAFYLDLRDNDPNYTNFTYYLSDGRSYQTNLWTQSGKWVKPFELNTHIVPFHDEPGANPCVSLLLEDGLTYTNTVNVWDNKSTGATTLGNWTNAVSSCSFTGPVQLRRDVTLAANAGSTVTFSGEFTDLTDGGTNLVVSGGGTCDVTAATLDTKLALAFAGGTLNLTQSQLAAARGLSWRMADDSTGHFAVTGSCDLSGLSLDLPFTEEANRETVYVIGTASGGFTGRPAVTGLAKNWHLVLADGELSVRYWKPGLIFSIR